MDVQSQNIGNSRGLCESIKNYTRVLLLACNIAIMKVRCGWIQPRCYQPYLMIMMLLNHTQLNQLEAVSLLDATYCRYYSTSSECIYDSCYHGKQAAQSQPNILIWVSNEQCIIENTSSHISQRYETASWFCGILARNHGWQQSVVDRSDPWPRVEHVRPYLI